VALVARGGTPLHELELTGRATFVLGAERAGLPEELVAQSDQVATIVTTGEAESLNVAVAGAIALYERSRH
jgi:tRNA G18 (ribose-2'-O)-methylase SpoU